MIDRYALPELRELFSERRKLEVWLRVEMLVVEALNAAGVIPDDDWQRIRAATAGGGVDPARAHDFKRIWKVLESVLENSYPDLPLNLPESEGGSLAREALKVHQGGRIIAHGVIIK